MAADHRLQPGDLWRIAQPAVAMVLELRHIIDAAKRRLPVFGNLPFAASMMCRSSSTIATAG
jgi:hypothetical protein